MRILYVVTKPPWPPVDGGRLLVETTLSALLARGHEIDLVTPFDPAETAAANLAGKLGASGRVHAVASRPRAWPVALCSSIATGEPLTIARHRLPAVSRTVSALLARDRYDVVHVEQLQALAACSSANPGGPPVVLRCQNVESDLWAGRARLETPLRPLLAREAARLARFEAHAVAGAAATVALTEADAARLAEIAGAGHRPVHVAAPHPSALPAGPELDGEPALVTLASRGWQPNSDGLQWLLRDLWPVIRSELPRAVLHVFGESHLGAKSAAGVVAHGAPAESRTAFAANAIFIACLRHGSGVRMRILEAWARGLPVIATPAAAAGLEARDGRELLIARSGAEVTAAIRCLRQSDERTAMVAAARARLEAAHAPATVARQLEAVYEEARH